MIVICVSLEQQQSHRPRSTSESPIAILYTTSTGIKQHSLQDDTRLVFFTA